MRAAAAGSAAAAVLPPLRLCCCQGTMRRTKTLLKQVVLVCLLSTQCSAPTSGRARPCPPCAGLQVPAMRFRCSHPWATACTARCECAPVPHPCRWTGKSLSMSGRRQRCSARLTRSLAALLAQAIGKTGRAPASGVALIWTGGPGMPPGARHAVPLLSCKCLQPAPKPCMLPAHAPCSLLTSKCAGLNACTVYATNEWLGRDPCPTLGKVLSFTFQCGAAGPTDTTGGVQNDPVLTGFDGSR